MEELCSHHSGRPAAVARPAPRSIRQPGGLVPGLLCLGKGLPGTDLTGEEIWKLH